MFEKVNPMHPDKIADRIAGAIVDLAYKKEDNPRIAVEVLIGHGGCMIIAETSIHFPYGEIESIVSRISGKAINLNYIEVPQDEHLSDNQSNGLRCGDNGIFCGMPITEEQKAGRCLAQKIYDKYKTDGKYIVEHESSTAIICQSYAGEELKKEYPYAIVNPLGYWTGGIGVDAGATNRKLGSDMGDAVTGGGLHGKDLSKADVAVNIYCHIKAQETGKPYKTLCAIGDTCIDGKPYSEVVEIAMEYINSLGGFEKFAEWGLI